jgi:lipopolysaccharide cholinephosphotransferase
MSENRAVCSQVQQIILDMMKELLPVIKENGWRYYMLGGTLLGAVRHKGFIPWDDDIDIGMPREDYDAFLAKIGESLPDYLRLDTYESNPEHHYYFSRIVDTRYSMRREGSIEERTENVWVDIFPLDGMPNGAFAREFHQFHLLAVRALYHISCFERVNLQRPNRPLSERIIIRFVQVTGFGRKADTKMKLRKLDRLLRRYPYEKSDYIVNFMGQYKFKEMFPKRLYGEGQDYPFEDITLHGPKHYDEILTQMYGDYMTPPKEEDRNAHAAHFVEKETKERI